ncbi:MAG: peptidoglycan editing factor PgeF [Pseudomonadota bacterium]
MNGEVTGPLLVPHWPLPAGVRAVTTTRCGAGASSAPWDRFNLGDYVGDDAASVAANRRKLGQLLGDVRPRWLSQVHGSTVVDLDVTVTEAPAPVADAAVTAARGQACALLTADCLPVLLCACSGAVVGAAHAGWRGLAGGVLEAAVHAMGTSPAHITAWLGPCISQRAFEVGPEVREAFLAQDVEGAAAFASGQGDRWFADLQRLAHQRLVRLGLAASAVYRADACTYREGGRFFSYRRDGTCGRMATLIWRVTDARG